MHTRHMHVKAVECSVDLAAMLAAVLHSVWKVNVLHVFAHVAAIFAHLAT
jgi:hypothetical protein